MTKHTSDPNHPLCYRCKHAREIPGNAHRQCRAPVNRLTDADEKERAAVELAATMAARTNARLTPGERAALTPATIDAMERTTGIAVEMHELGIQGGWAFWPYNFDPVWLKSCNAFEEER